MNCVEHSIIDPMLLSMLFHLFYKFKIWILNHIFCSTAAPMFLDYITTTCLILVIQLKKMLYSDIPKTFL